MDVEIDDYASQPVSGVPLDHKLKHNEEGVPENSEKSSIVVGSTSGSLNSDNVNGSNSDQSYHNNDDADEAMDEDDDYLFDDEDDDDYMYDDDDAEYNSMQAQFDNVDLPPGVEASVSWMPETVASNNNPASTSTSSVSDVVAQPQPQPQPQPAWMSNIKIYDPDSSKTEAATSSSTVPAEPSNDAVEDGKAGTVMERYQLFPKFDVVEDFSDHYFFDKGFSAQEQPPTSWLKKVREDWKSLEHNLPDTIFVRVYEARMDLLRAIIVGPAGTPYHDGLFVFDVLFPPTYPAVPPLVHYHSGGLRINPNLYNCGKVCLSLLNTWSGQSNEMWLPKTSTMLQVLVSIQGLILNTEPYFNEPGYESSKGTPEGIRKSREYSENVFILSLKTMIYTLRKPPKHFEDLVAGHFRVRAHAILSACKAYVEGAELGSPIGEGAARKAGSHSQCFKESVTKMMNGLVSSFTRFAGVTDLEKYRVQS